jgi:DNA-binding NarL/FixJ family response regulator
VNTELSGVSGCELCSMLKTRDGRVPVLLVADVHSNDLERAALSARPTAFVVKPAHDAWIAEGLSEAAARHVHGSRK